MGPGKTGGQESPLPVKSQSYTPKIHKANNQPLMLGHQMAFRLRADKGPLLWFPSSTKTVFVFFVRVKTCWIRVC